MIDREYLANAEGLNIVIGATLGFVLAGSESLRTIDFIAVLAFTIDVVTSILYISASTKRVGYSCNALVNAAAMPLILNPILSKGASLPTKLQPTLAVWALVSCLIKFVPRRAPASVKGEVSEQD